MKERNYFVCVLCVWLFLDIEAIAQQHRQVDRRFFNEDGLSQNTVSSIYQDDQGYMWFGTFDGLNRYDGYKFTEYKNNPSDSASLVNNFILATLKDRKGNLWIGTSEGIDVYNPREDNFIHVPFGSQTSQAGKYVNFIYEDHQARLWLGSRNGLHLFDPRSKRFVHFVPPLPAKNWNDRHVEVVSEDAAGNLWMGYKNGLARYNWRQNAYTPYQHQPNDPGTMDDNGIHCLYAAPSGKLWVGTGKGLSQYDPKMYFGGINGLNIFHPDSIQPNPTLPPVVITAFYLFN